MYHLLSFTKDKKQERQKTERPHLGGGLRATSRLDCFPHHTELNEISKS